MPDYLMILLHPYFFVPMTAAFVVALLGNYLAVEQRWTNALVTAIATAALAALALWTMGEMHVAQRAATVLVLMVVIELAANATNFKKPVASAAISALLFAAPWLYLMVGLIYYHRAGPQRGLGLQVHQHQKTGIAGGLTSAAGSIAQSAPSVAILTSASFLRLGSQGDLRVATLGQ